jgi:hypothetical protein
MSLTTVDSGLISSGAITLTTQVSGTLPEANGGTGTTVGYCGFKNKIFNGQMQIDQRNAGASVTPTANAYTLDRWYALVGAASKMSFQQSTTTATGFVNSVIATTVSAYSVAATDTFAFLQAIEGFNVSDLGFGTANAKTVTLSFWVRSSLTGTFGGALSNNAYNRSYPFTYTISAANTFEYKTITIAGDTSGTWTTDNSAGLRVYLGMGVGTTYSGTAGAWAGAFYASATGATSVVGTNGATFYITGVQLEKGSTATSFDYRPYGTELALCQRYYYSIVNASSIDNQWGPTGRSSTTVSSISLYLPVQMRTAPAIYSVASSGFFFRTVEYDTAFNIVTGGINGLSVGLSWNNQIIEMSFTRSTVLAGTYVYQTLDTFSITPTVALTAEL